MRNPPSPRIHAAISIAILLTAICVLSVPACTASAQKLVARPHASETGKATWYGGKFQGRKTASGERFDKRALTAAHKTLPFGTIVEVTNLENNQKVRVRINDRGPYGKGRVIDVSEAAAKRLNMIRSGVIRVRIEVIRVPPKPKKRNRSRQNSRQP